MNRPVTDTQFIVIGKIIGAHGINGNLRVRSYAESLSSFEPGKPNLVLAHTVKGKGVSFIENQLTWHHKVPTDEQLAAALAELEQMEQQLREGAAV